MRWSIDNPPLVFQASSGDSNPNDMKRIVGLVGLYKRQHFEEKETGNKIVNKLAGMVETQTGETANLRTGIGADAQQDREACRRS